MSSDDRLRRLLEDLRPPGGLDVDAELAAVRRRAARRPRSRAFLASAAAVALVAGTVAIVAAVRGATDDGGSVAGGGERTPACVSTDDIQGEFATFATGTLPNGQRYELRARGESPVFEVELLVDGSRVLSIPVGEDGSDTAIVRTARIGATGRVLLALGRVPTGQSVRVAFEDGESAEYGLIDGPGAGGWFVGVAPSATTAKEVILIGADGRTRELQMSALDACANS